MTQYSGKNTGQLKILISVLVAAFLAGCASMAPEYQRPAAHVPTAYSKSESTQNGIAAHKLAWSEFFADPVLISLIETALQNNRDLRMAILRVDEARSTFQIRRSERFPEIGVSAQAARSQLPGDLSPVGQPIVGGEYRSELGLTTWELDLWGRVRSLETAALESWLATEAAQQAVHVALIAQVANGYFSVQELNERVQIAHESVATREKSYQIFQRRYEAGAISKLDVTLVQTLLTQAQSMLAQLEQQRDVQINALRLLLGTSSDISLQQMLADENSALSEVSAGLPSELLNNRPDIIAAEHRLRAANANIGAARAAFFPRIALTGSFGTASAALDGLFASGSKAWAFVPVVSLPIFDAGSRQASLDLSEVRRDLAVAEYEKTIQNAFREVADALSARHWLREQLDSQLVGRAAQAERARLAQLRYDRGAAAYLEVLDAQRDLLELQQQVVQTRSALLSSHIALYSALGGGINTNHD